MSNLGITPVTQVQRTIVGPVWNTAALAFSLTNLDLILASAGLATGRFTFPYTGRVVGIVRELNAALSAGNLTVSMFKNGSSAGTVGLTSASGIRGKHLFADISYATDDSLHIKVTTDVGFLGATTLVVYPLMVFDV